MKKLLVVIFISAVLPAFAQKNKIEQDKEAIKSMIGCYKVTFDFAETFSPDTAYKLHHPHHSWGIEIVSLVEETKNKIVLQHLLIIDDSTIIKHWRQDWIYQNAELLQFDKDNHWKKVILPSNQVKGQWTQKVYQVDDSPRYEGNGTWTHVDGKHKWESTTDAPLPRREFTTRNDYNVLNRRSQIYMTTDGWMFEQDNQKIVRSENGDKLIAWEKGFEKFTRVEDGQCIAGANWWNINKEYWSDVRVVWNDVFAKTSNLNLKKKVDDTLLWEKLFKLGEETTKKGKNNSAENQAAIRAVIQKHLQS